MIKLAAKLIINCPTEYLGWVTPQDVVDVAAAISSGEIAPSSANVIFKELYDTRDELDV